MKPERSEFVQRSLRKANDTLGEVSILIENKLWNIAVNRLYYACFYAVSALLHSHGHDSKTHRGSQQSFGLHFIKTGIIDKEMGKFYAILFEMRQDADYEDTVEYDEVDVQTLFPTAKKMIAAIETIMQGV